MSATSELEAGGVLHSFFEKHWPKRRSKEIVTRANDQIVGDISKQPPNRWKKLERHQKSLVGTALSYRAAIGISMDLTQTPAYKGRCEAIRWAPETNRLWKWIVAFVEDTLAVIAKAREDREDLDLDLEMELGKASIALAGFDSVYRAQRASQQKIVDALLEALPRRGGSDFQWDKIGGHSDVIDMVRLLHAWLTVNEDEWVSKDWKLFPTPSGAVQIGGAEGDLLAGDTLVEFKCSSHKRPVNRGSLLQAVSYALLDFDDTLGIRNIALYYPCHTHTLHQSADGLLRWLSGESGMTLFDWRRRLAEHLAQGHQG